MAELHFIEKPKEVNNAIEAIQEEFCGQIKELKEESDDPHLAKLKLNELLSDKELLPLLNDIIQKEHTLTEEEVKEFRTRITEKIKKPKEVVALNEFFAMLFNRALVRAADEKLLEKKRAQKRKIRKNIEQRQFGPTA